jgi:hypothetical protein
VQGIDLWPYLNGTFLSPGPGDTSLGAAGFSKLAKTPLSGNAIPTPHPGGLACWRDSELSAYQLGAYKATFVTESGFNDTPPVYYDPPLLYNLDWD